MDRGSDQTSNELPDKELKPQSLHKNGIEFREDENRCQEAAANVASLQAELLDFRNIIAVNDAEQISRHQIPDSSLLGAGSEKSRQRFDRARLISEEASDMREGDEDLWVAFIKEKVFCGWGSSQKPRRPVDYFCLTGGVAMNGPSVQWNEAARHRDGPAKDILTAPKPDIYFAIQIHDSLPEPSGFLNQALQNFTFSVLNSCQDLHYSPSKRCNQSTGEYHKHQVCFPFVIVEVKHESVHDTERQHCYCQAVNAASSALAMLCSLNRHHPRARYWHADQHEILPIVTFTFIGYNVKVWLAYISYYARVKDKGHMHKYRMQCIWSGDISKVWDAAQLCSIVDKVAEWFFYIYRPWISTCLDQWKALEAEKRLKRAHESFLDSRGPSQVDIRSTGSNNSDVAAQLSVNSLTPFSLPYREPVKEVRPSSIGGFHSRSRSAEDISDSSMFRSRQPRSRGRRSDFNPGNTSKYKSIDRPSDFNPSCSNFSTFGERPSTEGSSGSHASKDKDRPSSKINERPSTGGFGSSASKSNNRPYDRSGFGSMPFKSDERLSAGSLFGVSSSKPGFGASFPGFGSGAPSSRVIFGASSSRSLFSSSVSNSNERASARASSSPASKPKKGPLIGRSDLPASKTEERPSTGGFGSPPPKTDGRPFPRSIASLPAPENTEEPPRSNSACGIFRSTHTESSDKPSSRNPFGCPIPKNTKKSSSRKAFGSASPSPQLKTNRMPSNSRRSASTSSEDIESPSSSGTLDSHFSEDEEPFNRSGASSIGRDKHGSPGSEAARAGYYYRLR